MGLCAGHESPPVHELSRIAPREVTTPTLVRSLFARPSRSLVASLPSVASGTSGENAGSGGIYNAMYDGAWQTAQGNTWLAQSFTTGSSSMTLNSVQVWIRNADEADSSSTPSSMTLYLYATDANGAPIYGAPLETIVSNASFASNADEQPVYNATYILAANTTYAIIMQGSAGGTIGWKYSVSGQTPTTWLSVTQPGDKNWLTNNSGMNWIGAAPAGASGFSMVVNASSNGTAGSGGSDGGDDGDALAGSGATISPGGAGSAGSTSSGPSGTTGGVGGAGGAGGDGGIGGTGGGV